MKKYLVIFIVLFTFSCNVEESPEYQNLKAKNDSLFIQNSDNIETINDFVTSFNKITENLHQIKEKEAIITLTTKDDIEDKQKIEDKINEDIQLIYELMLNNKQIIASLNKKLKNSNLEITELQKMLTHLKEQIQKKEVEINKLKEQLSELDIIIEDMTATINTLAIENEDQSSKIEKQTVELNTAYYVYGTDKELKENKIITKQGGFIGIGRTEKLKDDFNRKYFTKIDIIKTKSIPIFRKKAEIITSHPSDSYKFIGKDKIDSLIITNPDSFWKASKYLVIKVD